MRAKNPLSYAPACALLLLTACGGGAGSQAGSNLPTPSPQPTGDNPATSQSADSWPMQSGNVLRDGFQNGSIGLSSAVVPNLKLAWSANLGTVVQASPVVGNGKVYVATLGGDIVALDESTGAELWSTELGSFVRGTPTLDGNILIVPMYNPGGVAALDATSGTPLWTISSSTWSNSSPVRSEPLVLNGMVYVGTAGGDAPSCNAGTVAAISETTGAIAWTWSTAAAGQGIAVWSPISASPNGDIIFGTGNGCSNGLKYVESTVALNATTGAFDWQAATSQQGPDVDVGGGIAETGSSAFFSGKDGNFYAVNLANGAPLWKTSLGSVPGFGSIGTPAVDGTNVITQSGALSDPNQNSNPTSVLFDFGTNGSLRWKTAPFQSEQFSSPVITGDLVIVDADTTLQVRSLQTGSLLWSYNLGSFIYASPAVVKSGIYTVSHGTSSTGATVAAFTYSGSSQAALKRSLHVSRRPILEDWHPWSGR